jgi:branched-chain amino acid aminotransferase
MWVFLNGQFVPEEQAVVSIFDRSYRYGDGLFEAVLVRHGKFFRWGQHMARLERSAQFLKIVPPFSSAQLRDAAQRLIERNGVKDIVVRIQLSRGTGPRGYAPSGEEKASVVMTLHPAPQRPIAALAWKLIVSSFRAAVNDPLLNHKTCSRLLQVVAATEARERGADEALVLNTDSNVTEGSTSNVFWIDGGTVCTPPLGVGVLPGITRAVLIELCAALHIPTAERMSSAEQLLASEGVFLSFTSRGVIEAESLDGTPLRRSPITARLREAFEELLERECAA